MIVFFYGCNGKSGNETLQNKSATEGFVLVSEISGNTVAKIDVATDQISARATVGSSPQFIAGDQSRRLAYVSVLNDNKIVAVDVDTMETADLVIPDLGKQPIGVTLTQSGDTLLVATRGSDGVISDDDRLDVVTLNPESWPPSASLTTSIYTGKNPITAILDHNGRYAVITVRNEPAILVVDMTTYEIVYWVPDLPTDAEPEGGDAHPTENVVYVSLHWNASTIEVIDLDLLEVANHVSITNSSGMPVQPSAVRFTPDGSRLYVSGQTINKVLLFDTSDARNPVQNSEVELSTGLQPHYIVWLPDDRAYVANTNNNQPYGSISAIDSYSGTPGISEELLTDLAGPLSFVYFSNAY